MLNKVYSSSLTYSNNIELIIYLNIYMFNFNKQFKNEKNKQISM